MSRIILWVPGPERPLLLLIKFAPSEILPKPIANILTCRCSVFFLSTNTIYDDGSCVRFSSCPAGPKQFQVFQYPLAVIHIVKLYISI